ncbi:MAG: hypothetical protein PHH08_01685 [Candidatus ainarchaeum sp.]|nr:hypothetical protein [Candidatus ainarchaeum sp.]
MKDVTACRAFLGKFKSGGAANLGETDFESKIGMFAFVGAVPVGQIKLNFEVEKGKRLILVDAIQGQRGTKNLRWAFKGFSKISWPNYLIRKAVETAREAGFAEIRITKPEANPHYRRHANETEAEAGERQKRMRALYSEVAKAEGFKEAEEFFFKKIG